MEKVLINLAPPSLPTVPLLHIFFHFLFQILNSPLPQLHHLLNKAIHFLLRDGSSDDFHDIARVRSIETVPMIDDVHLGVYLFLQYVGMKTKYITPRICIALVSSQGEVQKLKALVESRHKQYYHFFNLTGLQVGGDKESGFKWRGPPFSLTETIKILTLVDAFLRMNLANSAVLCVSGSTMETYALFTVKTYLQICSASIQPSKPNQTSQNLIQLADKLTNQYPYLTREIQEIYRTIKLESPPVKILESLELEPSTTFIPIIEIFTEGRYNDYQLVYTHSIEESLATYYLDLNQPLETGIGIKCYDSKPQKKYFSCPVPVAGDVKIKVYSYRHLIKVHQFTLGFNTRTMDILNSSHPGVILLQDPDIYERNKDLAGPLTIRIQFCNFCENAKCSCTSSCQECKEMIKKLGPRYSDCQHELQKLHRVRTKEEVQVLLSL